MSYRESQERIVEAEVALKAGDTDRARVLFCEAAQLQRNFVESLPPERVRTKSVYGLSVASLLYRAGDLAEAERLASRLLGEEWIERHAAEGIRELLAQIWLDRGEPIKSALGTEAPEPSTMAKRSSRPPARRRRQNAPVLPIMGSGRGLAMPRGMHP